MSPLPTVRVKNPSAPNGFMVINQSDLRQGHELWPEQEPGYVDLTLKIDPKAEEAIVAHRVLGKIVREAQGISESDWIQKKPQERVALMLDMEGRTPFAHTKPVVPPTSLVQGKDAGVKPPWTPGQ